MGQICHHFSWTLDYLLWGIDWRIVQRMLIDAPDYDSDNKEEKTDKKSIKLTEQNSESIMEMLKKYQ